MGPRTAIVNASGDYDENIQRLATHLGKDKMRRAVMDIVYGRGSKPKSKKQIAAAIGQVSSMQVVQNAVEYLAKHHLITGMPNDGIVDDGSRRVYCKDEFVRANRPKIISLADDPKKREKLATKRSAAIQSVSTVAKVPRQAIKKRSNLVVLYLLANPDPDPDPKRYIRPEAEARMVQEAVRASKFRENIKIELRVAADLKTILQGLNDFSPKIVHFSGHGNAHVLAMDTGAVTGKATQAVSYELLGEALEATDRKPSIVVLNSCFSSKARKAILKSVDAMVGMTNSIGDVAAAAFAQQFYAALAAGQSLESAFKQGRVAVAACSISEKETPELYTREGVDASKIVLT